MSSLIPKFRKNFIALLQGGEIQSTKDFLFTCGQIAHYIMELTKAKNYGAIEPFQYGKKIKNGKVTWKSGDLINNISTVIKKYVAVLPQDEKFSIVIEKVLTYNNDIEIAELEYLFIAGAAHANLFVSSITPHKGDLSGGRTENFPRTRLTKLELSRFNDLRKNISAADFIVKLLNVYERSQA